MVKVYLDPGHGGHDSGAVGHGLREKDIVLKIGLYTRDYLQNNYNNVQVRMSRSTDKFLSLSQRTKDANNWGADSFTSIHINSATSSSANGYEDYIYNGNVSSHTPRLQDSIHGEVASLFNRNRGQKRANFAVLRQSAMPACLTENGFVSNKQDADFLREDSNLRKLGEAHAIGIAKFHGLSRNSGGSPDKPIYRVRKSWDDAGSQIGAFENLSNAKSLADEHGYNVYDSDGNRIYRGTKPNNQANLTVDGKWGPATTRALQVALNTSVDGVISSQPENSVTRALYGGVTWGSNGSMVIRELQRKIGATVDGKLGPGTIRALQRYLGTPVDGVISRPSSLVVEELQRRLNAGTF